MYNKSVLNRFQNPKNAGLIKNADGVGEVGNAKCGDIMRIYLKVENGIIIDAKFKTFGCAAAIASTDVACDMIKGMTIEEALKVTNSQVIDELGGLPPVKIHCSILAEEAIHAAIDDYYKRKARLEKKKDADLDDLEEDED